MRVSELADLTGTTVRTVRYYHQVGLLPVPETRNGHRDYDLGHVARVIRIRWLTAAGVALSRVATLLPPAGDDGGPASAERALADLNESLSAVDKQIQSLQAQRELVCRLIRAAEQHGRPTPMPPVMVRFYDEVERRAQDEDTRRLIRWERDFNELAFYRGELPLELAALFTGFDDARYAESVADYRETAARMNRSEPLTEEEITEICGHIVARIRRQLGPHLTQVARSIALDHARRTADLYLRLADRGDRRLERAVSDALLSMLESEGS